MIIWHLRKAVPRLEVQLFPRRKLCPWNRQISGTCSEVLQECLHFNSCGTSWPLVSYSINLFGCEDPRKHIKGPKWLWSSRWRYPNGILLWLVVQPMCASGNKKLPLEFTLVQVPSDNVECPVIQYLPSHMGARLREYCCWKNFCPTDVCK